MAEYQDTKEPVVLEGAEFSANDRNQAAYELEHLGKYIGTHIDRVDMATLGKKQQLRRNFGFLSMLGFCTTLMSTWEVMLTTCFFSLLNGGLAGSIYSFMIVATGYTCIIASMAEMASIAPTSGGQYHWVSEFAPRSMQKYLSYITAWLCITSWQSGISVVTFLGGTSIQGLLVLNYPDYIFHAWHGTLLVIALATFCVLFNTFLVKKLPMIEGIMFLIHVFGFFAILIPLWVLGPRQDPSVVFTQFANGGMWNSNGTSVMVGMLTSTVSLLGADSAVHMAEEIQDASIILPRSMMWAIAVNSVLGLTMLITLCFTLGDLNYVLSTPTAYPYIQILFDVTNSLAGTNVMTALIIVTVVSSAISNIAAASRQLWSFARDQGPPGSRFLSHVYVGWDIPLNAVMISWFVTVLLSLINLGSTIALNSITSIGVNALLVSYFLSIGCLVAKRLRREPLPARRWSLGAAGMPINVAGMCFLVVFFLFSLFPTTSTVTAQTMNYGCVMFGGVFVLATTYYIFIGRHHYVPPVLLVKRDM